MSPSVPAAGAATSPSLRVDVVLDEPAAVVTTVTLSTLSLLLELVEIAATLGTAVHRRPLMVVRKAPGGNPLVAMLLRRNPSLLNQICGASRPG